MQAHVENAVQILGTQFNRLSELVDSFRSLGGTNELKVKLKETASEIEAACEEVHKCARAGASQTDPPIGKIANTLQGTATRLRGLSTSNENDPARMARSVESTAEEAQDSIVSATRTVIQQELGITGVDVEEVLETCDPTKAETGVEVYPGPTP